MKREHLPIDALSAWARLNGVSMSGIAFRQVETEDGTDKGYAIVATKDRETEGPDPDVLLQVPPDLILSLDTVGIHAKSDPYLREVLEAVGEYGTTARGAISIFLLLQITYSSPDFANEPERIGLSNPWTEYIKFMPPSILIPTFYMDEELELLRGTSLQTPIEAKLTTLERELLHLRQSTENIPWCRKYWWDEETGKLTLDDWKFVDAAFRSRSMDLPGHGSSMVPCIDMANHASKNAAKALFDKDTEENALLQVRRGRTISAGEEVTISYGDDISASELLFSYGFLEKERTEAKELLLDVDIPDDDPLKIAKKFYSRETPLVKFWVNPESSEAMWQSPIVLWACVNQEDGLHIRVLQKTDESVELGVTWKGEELREPQDLPQLLQKDPLWDIFCLRAIVLVLERLENQYLVLRATEKAVSEIRQEEEEDMLQSTFRSDVFWTVSKLHKLEDELLIKCIDDFTEKRQALLESEAVASYLIQQAGEHQEDFS